MARIHSYRLHQLSGSIADSPAADASGSGTSLPLFWPKLVVADSTESTGTRAGAPSALGFIGFVGFVT